MPVSGLGLDCSRSSMHRAQFPSLSLSSRLVPALVRVSLLLIFGHVGAAAPAPNLVLILADDLGWGDPVAFNPDSKVSTPHLDRLAAEGLRFTDAHTPSAVCTPTRYALLTS